MYDIDLTTVTTPNVIIFKMFGFWKPDTVLSFLLKIFSGFMLLSFWITQFIFLITHLNDLRLVTSCAYAVLTFSMNSVKLVFMYSNISTILAMFDKLKTDMFMPKCQKHLEIATSSKIHITKVFYFCLSLGLTVDVFWAIYPLSSVDIILPFKAWFPFVYSGTIYYYLIYGFQVVAATMNTVICLNLDCFTSSLLVQVGIQCDILSATLQDLDKFELDGKGKLYEVFNKEKSSDKLRDNLIYCIKHHKEIKKFAKHIEDIHFVSVFLLFGVGSFVLCASLFEISVVNPVSMEFAMLVSYSSAILTELYLYCWYGNEVIVKSGMIFDSIFKAPWRKCDIKYKKTMLMFMMGSRKPIIVYVGGLFTMSIPVYIAILRSSYSYYTLLRKVYA